MLSDRQEKILNLLIKEYLDSGSAISSGLLQKRLQLDISPATIRNELQELTELGYVIQPHTSAGRIPTEKGYRFFVQITFSQNTEKFPSFILREIESAKEKIDRELTLAKELTKSLEQLHSVLEFERMEEQLLFDALKIIGSSQESYHDTIGLMTDLLKRFEGL